MKEKGLYLVTILLFALLFFGVYTDSKKASSTDSETAAKPVVGILQYVTHPSLDAIEQGIEDGLAEAGYGKDQVDILLMNPQADQSKIQTMGQQLVNKSDVLVGIATPAAQGLANLTKDTPLVMGAVSYPVQAGLVTSEEKPEGQITGVTGRPAVGEQMKFIQEILPDVKNIAVLYSSNEDNSKAQAEDAKTSAAALGITVNDYVVSNTNDIKAVAQKALAENDCIYLPQDNTVASAVDTVVQLAMDAKKAIFPSVTDQLEQGGLATIGIDQHQIGIDTGKMVAEILDGKKPKDIPVYSSTEGQKTINKAVAEKLGITFSADVLKEAKDITEISE